MRGSASDEAEIMAQVLSLRDDPAAFVAYAFPWGRPGSPLEKFSGPRKWQQDELRRMSDHIQGQIFAMQNGLPLKVCRSAKASGRGPGKSALFGMVAHYHLSTHIGAPCIVTANTEAQLRMKTFPEFAAWVGSAINSHWFLIESMKISPAPWLLEIIRKLPEEGGLGIDPKYWYCAGQTWSEENPDAFAGAHNPYGMMLLMDEAAGIPAPIWNVSEGFFTEINPYRFHLAASQRRTTSGRFHELFEDPAMSDGWHTETLSTRGMEGVDQAVIESQIKRYGADSDFVRVEIDGLPPRTSEDQFVPWDAVRAAQTNDLFRDEGETLINGVDPAPRGRTAWRFRQGRNARDCCGGHTKGILEGQDNVQIAQHVINLVNRFQPDAVCIDFGMGTGVIDILKRKPIGRKIHEVRFGDSPHTKSNEWATHAIELWGKVREWLPGGMVEKDEGEKGSLSKQLTDRGWRWSGREDGKKILETKEDLKKRGVMSPDDADALACTFEVTPQRRAANGYSGVRIAEGVGSSMVD